MGRQRYVDSASMMSTLRGFNLHKLEMSGRRMGLASDGRGRLKLACTLIGAGAVGVLLALKLNSRPPSLITIPSGAGLFQGLTSATEESPVQQQNVELTIPGLLNVGNNCFLNVVLQALASSKSVIAFLTTCTATNKEKASSCTTGPVRMPLAVSVSSLMKELSELGESSRSSSPRKVMLALRSYARHFDLASQQDAAEALVHLATALQEERDNYVQWVKPTYLTFAAISNYSGEGGFSPGVQGRCKDSSGADQLLESWRVQLHWPLEGTLSSSLTCQRCAHQSTTHIQFFNDIALSPSQDMEGNIRRGCTLESCLEQFTRPEWIDDVKCSNCSHEAAAFSINSIFRDYRSLTSKGSESEGYSKALQENLQIIEECGCDETCACASLTRQQGGIWRDVHANASKQLKIGRSPEVLCFQLQRMTMSAEGGLKKLTGHVAFPKVLDLFPFTIAAENCDQRKQNITYEAKDTSGGNAGCQEIRFFDFPAESSHFVSENEVIGNGAVDLAEENSNGHYESLHISPTSSPEICIENPQDFEDCGGTPDANIGKAAEDIPVGLRQAVYGNKVLTNGATYLVHGNSNGQADSSPHISIQGSPVKCIADMHHSEDCGDRSGGSVIKAEGDRILASEFEVPAAPVSSPIQSLLPLDGLFDDLASTSPFWSTNNGSVLMSSPLSSISLPYAPMTFSQIQSWSLATLQRKQVGTLVHPDGLLRMSDENSVSNSLNRPGIRKVKYNRTLLYGLVSVLVHQGGSQSGHYIVYRKVTRPNTELEQEPRLVSDDPSPSLNVEFRTKLNYGFEQESREAAYALSSSANTEATMQGSRSDVNKFGTQELDVYTPNMRDDILDESSKPFAVGNTVHSKRVENSKREEPNDLDQDEGSVKDDILSQDPAEGQFGGSKQDSKGVPPMDNLVSFWFRVSDTHVQRVPEQEVFDAHASLLFYEQI